MQLSYPPWHSTDVDCTGSAGGGPKNFFRGGTELMNSTEASYNAQDIDARCVQKGCLFERKVTSIPITDVWHLWKNTHNGRIALGMVASARLFKNMKQ